MRKSFSLAVVVLISVALAACSFSRPPSRIPGSKPVRIMKFVPYAHDQAVKAYFTLADAETNQVAAGGTLRIRVFTKSQISIMQNDKPSSSMTLERSLYDNTFAVGVTNFHWDHYGFFFRVDDLAMHFMVPYQNMIAPIPHGRVVTVQIDFSPEGVTNRLAAARKIVLY